MFLIYDLIFIILTLLYIPRGLFSGKLKSHFLNRRGVLPEEVLAKLKGKKVIWLHAVSVGEVLSTKLFLTKLKEQLKDFEILVTTTTATGNLMAKNMNVAQVAYTPLDLSFYVRRFINQVNPGLFIFVETEIWPNLMNELGRRQIPLVMIGGRVSESSFKGYSLVKFLVSPILKKVSLFCMQTSQDAERIISLGAKKEAVKILGNMKFDVAAVDSLTPDFVQKQHFLKQKLNLKEDELLLVAASTHRSEERIIIDICQQLKNEFPKLKLLIAPRHVDRAKEIKIIFDGKNLSVSLFSDKPSAENAIIDVMGELKTAYSLATVVFVGGSLVKHGGQNMIEPAYFSKPIIIGPWTFNFKDIMEAFKQARAIIEVENPMQLKNSLKEILSSPKKRIILGRNARSLVNLNQGASLKIADLVTGFIRNVKS